MAQLTNELKANEHASVLLVEPFYGGSHKQLIDLLHQQLSPHCVKYTMTAKKWHWRARTAALYFSQTIPVSTSYKTLFCSSVLNLAELTAMRTDLAKLRKILYFHENQLNYPVTKNQDRDYQYGYNQIISCLVADVILFNSKFNMESFLNAINSFCNNMPDYQPKNLPTKIRPKCSVLNFPIQFPAYQGVHESQIGELNVEKQKIENIIDGIGGDNLHSEKHFASKQHGHDGYTDPVEGVSKGEFCELNSSKLLPHGIPCIAGSSVESNSEKATSQPIQAFSVIEHDHHQPLRILWPHRWEHDKNPSLFFSTLFKLKEDGFTFNLSVLGERYSEIPAVFDEAQNSLKDNILHWGYLPSKEHYYKVLSASDVVVSTAHHEFFGVAMLEAVHLGVYPLCPNALVYPEIFPSECCQRFAQYTATNKEEALYNTEHQLYKKLKKFCQNPSSLRKRSKQIVVDTKQYSWDTLGSKYRDILMAR